MDCKKLGIIRVIYMKQLNFHKLRAAHTMNRILFVLRKEIMDMLLEMEQGRDGRHCKGRGQLNRNWQSTVRSAVRSLQKVPYQGKYRSS